MSVIHFVVIFLVQNWQEIYIITYTMLFTRVQALRRAPTMIDLWPTDTDATVSVQQFVFQQKQNSVYYGCTEVML